jgi:hypothetical protein
MHIIYKSHIFTNFQDLGVAIIRHNGSDSHLDEDFFEEEFDRFVRIQESDVFFEFNVQHPDPTYRYSDNGGVYTWGESWDSYLSCVKKNMDRFKMKDWIGKQDQLIQADIFELQRRGLSYSELKKMVSDPQWKTRIDYLLGRIDDDAFLKIVKEQGSF